MRINRYPALQALLVAAAIEIPCAALLEKAGNAFLLQAMLIALLAFLVLERRSERGERVITDRV